MTATPSDKPSASSEVPTHRGSSATPAAPPGLTLPAALAASASETATMTDNDASDLLSDDDDRSVSPLISDADAGRQHSVGPDRRHHGRRDLHGEHHHHYHNHRGPPEFDRDEHRGPPPPFCGPCISNRRNHGRRSGRYEREGKDEKVTTDDPPRFYRTRSHHQRCHRHPSAEADDAGPSGGGPLCDSHPTFRRHGPLPHAFGHPHHFGLCGAGAFGRGGHRGGGGRHTSGFESTFSSLPPFPPPPLFQPTGDDADDAWHGPPHGPPPFGPSGPFTGFGGAPLPPPPPPPPMGGPGNSGRAHVRQGPHMRGVPCRHGPHPFDFDGRGGPHGFGERGCFGGRGERHHLPYNGDFNLFGHRPGFSPSQGHRYRHWHAGWGPDEDASAHGSTPSLSARFAQAVAV